MHLCAAPAANGRSDVVLTIPSPSSQVYRWSRRKAGSEPAVRPPPHGSHSAATPPDEVPDDRDDRENQKEVNQSSSDMENAEPQEPGHDQNYCYGDEHDVFLQGEILYPACYFTTCQSPCVAGTTEPTVSRWPKDKKARGIPGWGSLRALAFGTNPDRQGCCTAQHFDFRQRMASEEYPQECRVIPRFSACYPTRSAPPAGSCEPTSRHPTSLAFHPAAGHRS